MAKMINKSGQSVAEYFLIMVVVLAAIIAVRFLGRIQGAFGGYFAKASSAMTEVK